MEDSPEGGPRRPKTPRWVVILAIAFAVAVVAIIVVALASGGEHGPGRHLPGGSQSQEAPAHRSP